MRQYVFLKINFSSLQEWQFLMQNNNLTKIQDTIQIINESIHLI